MAILLGWPVENTQGRRLGGNRDLGTLSWSSRVHVVSQRASAKQGGGELILNPVNYSPKNSGGGGGNPNKSRGPGAEVREGRELVQRV